MNNNINKKTKFVENNNNLNKQTFYLPNDTNSSVYEIVKNNFNSKNKVRTELKNEINPFNYELNYFNRIKKDIKGEEEFVYYSPYDQGPGRGFGNLNINNNIRKSEQSRNNNDNFKLSRESEIIDRFQFLDDRYSNSNNVVFPFPRNGENTRTYSEHNVSILDYNFNNPNFLSQNKNTQLEGYENYDQNTQLEIHENNDQNIQLVTGCENNNCTPNNLLVNSLNNQNKNQKYEQEKYNDKVNNLQIEIDKLKEKYGESLTRDIIINELNL